MKLKIFIVLALISTGFLNAQEPYEWLIITEVRMDAPFHAYIELTNMGTDPVNIGEFEVGRLSSFQQPWESAATQIIRLPDQLLQAGESFVIANAYDFNERTKPDHLLLADLLIHQPESSGDPEDEVSENSQATAVNLGRFIWYLRHYYDGDLSLVTDQVNGVFDEPDGTSSGIAPDVAGVSRALETHILVRRSIVYTGNIYFDSGRGVGPEDSEWIPIPIQYGPLEPDRSAFWTYGKSWGFSPG